jgi:hypothetical protein
VIAELQKLDSLQAREMAELVKESYRNRGCAFGGPDLTGDQFSEPIIRQSLGFRDGSPSKCLNVRTPDQGRAPNPEVLRPARGGLHMDLREGFRLMYALRRLRVREIASDIPLNAQRDWHGADTGIGRSAVC